MYCKLLYFNTRHGGDWRDGEYSWNEYTQEDIEVENEQELLNRINSQDNIPDIIFINNVFYEIVEDEDAELDEDDDIIYKLDVIPYE